jgi:hypothetical protein
MKSSFKSIVASIVVSSGLLLGATNANAVCTQLGAIEYSLTAANGTTFYITAVDAILPAFAYLYFAPLNTSFHETLSDAQAAGQIVKVTGSAEVCPAAGPFRNGGTVLRVDRFDQ